MAGCFFPSFGWPAGGDGDAEASLPSGEYREPFILPWPAPGFAVDGVSGFYGPSPSSSSSSSVALQGGSAVATATAAASKVHSLAERRRRERINGHLSTLRRMIPNADKMDKASLLWSVIQEVRVLKRKTLDIDRRLIIPAEVNQVSVECEEPKGTNAATCLHIRASICCEDRPDLLAEIVGAFRCLGLKAVWADMASLGGRVRHTFILRKVVAVAGGDDDVCLSSLMESTRDVLGKVASMEEAAPSGLSTKRRRLLHSHFSCVPYN